MRRSLRNAAGIVASIAVASPVIVFYLLDRIGTGLIALSTWAVAERSWSNRLFMTVDRIETWQARED